MSDRAWVEEQMKNISVPDNGALIVISELANQQIILEDKIALAEESLTKLKAEYNDLAGKHLPEAMAQVGLSEIKLRTGERVIVKPFNSAKRAYIYKNDSSTNK
jgi:diketogulonate reductase-like aldo/keto reductase